MEPLPPLRCLRLTDPGGSVRAPCSPHRKLAYRIAFPDLLKIGRLACVTDPCQAQRQLSVTTRPECGGLALKRGWQKTPAAGKPYEAGFDRVARRLAILNPPRQ